MSIIYKGTTVANAGGTYGGSSGSGEVYSTEETVIGTWIDGKPLYRRVFTVEVPAFSTNIPVSMMGYDAMYDIIHVVAKLARDDGYSTGINWVGQNVDYWYQIYDNTSTHQIQINGSSTASNLYAKTSAIIELEYTKTTD